MKALCVIVAAFLVCGFAHNDRLSKYEIIDIARKYASTHPAKNVLSSHAPEADILYDSKAWKGESIWIVTFVTLAPKDKSGKIIGERPFLALSVYLKQDGRVLNISLDTP